MVSKAQAVAHAGILALQVQNELATIIKMPTNTEADNAQVAAALKLIFVTRLFQGPAGAQRCQLRAKMAEVVAKPVRKPSVIVRFRIATQSQPFMDLLRLRILATLSAALVYHRVNCANEGRIIGEATPAMQHQKTRLIR
jgi:hypothetical protein